MIFILLFISLLFLTAGLVFIYKPAWIVRFNKFFRERILNDNLILLERRKKGFFFLLMFFIFFYWGYSRIPHDSSPLSSRLVTDKRLLYESRHHLQMKEYRETRSLCERVLSMSPNNSEALYQLAAAQFLLGDPASAKNSWSRAKTLNPNSEQADYMLKLVVRHKNLPSENIPEFK